MSRKIQIVLPAPVALQLQELADGRGEPLATFARQLRARRHRARRDGRQGQSARGVGEQPRLEGRPPAVA